MKRYLTEISETRIIPVTVIADSIKEASERALQGKGDAEAPIYQEPFVTRITVLDES